MLRVALRAFLLEAAIRPTFFIEIAPLQLLDDVLERTPGAPAFEEQLAIPAIGHRQAETMVDRAFSAPATALFARSITESSSDVARAHRSAPLRDGVRTLGELRRKC
jgi:hypothetical protein